MATNQPSSPPEAVVLDASFAIAICAKVASSEQIAIAQLAHYTNRGAEFYAPGVLVSEGLYVLCRKIDDGTLSKTDHPQAIIDLEQLAARIQPPPNGEASLLQRAEAIRVGYTCRRSADGIYIALAEQLAQTRQTVLLTFDKDIPKQAAANARGVVVKLL